MLCIRFQPRMFSSSRIGMPVMKSSNISTYRVIASSAPLILVHKWENKLAALGMAQGTYHQEDLRSHSFRSFLAKNAVNYLYISNFPGNVLLKNNNIGCPNISFGPSNTCLLR